MSEIYLGKPSQKIIDWCKAHYGTSYEGLCFTAEENGSSVKLQNVAGTYQTSTDGKNWSDYSLGTTINLNQGEKVYFSAKTTNETCWNDDWDSKFQMSGKIKASGNIQSLLDKECKRMDVPESCYTYMFCDCTSLTQAPELPATTLAGSCYNCMFQGCTSLTQAPQLPATTLADYCYDSMFYGCTALTQAPELPATTLANSCYYMCFNGCTALTQAPELPATTLANSCYSSMFEGCTSLTNAYFPSLPQITVINDVVGNQNAFYEAASNIETQCSDGTIYINDNN